MELKFKKRVSLDFIGDEYKDSYIDFISIPTKEFKVIQAQINKYQDDQDKSFDYMATQLKSRFVEGKVAQDGKLVDLSADNILDLPGNAFLECYKQIMGTPNPN